MNTPKNRTCLKCGWVAFGITRERAKNEVESFNKYFDTLTEKEREDFYGGRRSLIRSYERCFLCGGPHTNFRDSKEGDCPNGVTLQPIVVEE